jgi:hypothetical protein
MILLDEMKLNPVAAMPRTISKRIPSVREHGIMHHPPTFRANWARIGTAFWRRIIGTLLWEDICRRIYIYVNDNARGSIMSIAGAMGPA